MNAVERLQVQAQAVWNSHQVDATVTFTFDPNSYMPWTVRAAFVADGNKVFGETMEAAASAALGKILDGRLKET